MHPHINTVAKGNHLEESFYAYLKQQQNENRLLYGIYPSDQCRLLRKKKYYCKERERDVEFYVVLEVFRENADKPHLFVVFECKNYTGSVPEKKLQIFLIN
jgi:hypothetical protein